MGRRRVTTTKVQNILENAPEVHLSEIDVTDAKQERLIKLLLSFGITTTAQLGKYSDAELMDHDLFGPLKLEKLVELLTIWRDDGYPVKLKIDVKKPESIIDNLKRDVFLDQKNLEISSMRWNLQTYEAIAEYFNQSRQSINVKEYTTLKRFVNWYAVNNLSEKIGNFNDFRKYCEINFPESQRTVLDAVKRLVSMIK